jgi:hypothetical protein
MNFLCKISMVRSCIVFILLLLTALTNAVTIARPLNKAVYSINNQYGSVFKLFTINYIFPAILLETQGINLAL